MDNKNYAVEAKEKWGDTAAYKEFEKKDNTAAADGLWRIMTQFADCKANGFTPTSPAAQTLVAALRAYISEHFYTCTNAVLSDLGKMYVADARFRENIDRNGEGTAAFVSAAIDAYCK